MPINEYYAFMPLLLYGLAVGELLFRWRDYLKKERRYWPHIITGIVLLELAYANFFFMYENLSLFTLDYAHFLMQLIHPTIFFLIVSVYTPEADADVKEYFDDKLRILFTLLALFILTNLLVEFEMNVFNAFRLIGIIICALIAITKKFWIMWIFIGIRLSIFFFDYALLFS